MSCCPNNRVDGGMEVNQNHRNKHCTYDSVEMNGVETERLQPEIVTPAKERRRRPRHSQKRLLLVVVLLLSMACIALAAAYVALMRQVEQDREPKICLSKECIATSSYLLENINTSVDPCEDFFHYACGTWLSNNPIPAEKMFWGYDLILWKETLEVMKQLIEEDIVRDTERSSERKLKHLYRSCMNKEQIEDAKAEPLKRIIDRLQGWYAFGDWDADSWNMMDALILLHSEYWNDPMFTFWVDADDMDSSKNVILIDQGGLSWSEKTFINENTTNKVFSAYIQSMKTTADLLGASPQRIDQFVEDAITFQRSLAAITSAHGKPPNIYDTYNRLNLTQLQALAPAINWFQFFTEMFPNITSSTEVVVRVPNYMANLSKIVQSTPKRVLNNYMVWHVAQKYMNYMSISFRSVQERFNQAIAGTTLRDVAWRECVKLADDFLGMAFGALFVKKKFPAQSKRQVEYLIAEIKEAFREQLDAQDWMDEITKDAAREKVDAMVDLIGYPDYILNDTLLDKDYEFIDIKEDDFFHNVLSKVNYEYEKARKELHTPVTRHRWAMTPPEINAYYTAHQNVIVFPAGMLQWPYFDPTFPRSINYGGIGTVIGHELLHGFDDQGSLYDKVGNLHDWWTSDSWLKFQERSQCLVDAYSLYEIDGLRLNGATTLGENIADIGGLTQSYRAYKKVRERLGDEPPLPGINMTEDQLFFLAYSQNWCVSRRPENLRAFITAENHSPELYRVIGVLSQIKEFAEAFNCPVGSRMNPKERCRGIWW